MHAEDIKDLESVIGPSVDCVRDALSVEVKLFFISLKVHYEEFSCLQLKHVLELFLPYTEDTDSRSKDKDEMMARNFSFHSISFTTGQKWTASTV